MADQEKLNFEYKQLLGCFQRNESYKKAHDEKRVQTDNEYLELYKKYLENAQKINELKNRIAPLEQTIWEKKEVKFKYSELQVKFYTESNTLQKEIKEIKEKIDNERVKFTDGTNQIYDKIAKLPEGYATDNLKREIQFAQKQKEKLQELKYTYEVEGKRKKQKTVDVGYEIPPGVPDVIKEITEASSKDFGDPMAMQNRFIDFQRHVDVLKKKVSEMKLK